MLDSAGIVRDGDVTPTTALWTRIAAMNGSQERNNRRGLVIREGPVVRVCGQICFGIVGITLLFTTLLCPQTMRTQTTTLTTSAELVLIPTVVNNKSGSHISGLRKGESRDASPQRNCPQEPVAGLERDGSSWRGV